MGGHEVRPRPKRKLRGGRTLEGVLIVLFASYRKDAGRKAREWGLTYEEASRLFLGNCFYCGTPPKQNISGHFYNGIDRVDNKKGYLPTNVVSACGFCNMAKRGNSVQEFFAWIERLVSYNGQRHVPSQSQLQEILQVPEDRKDAPEAPENGTRE
jgi:hypothetical protein